MEEESVTYLVRVWLPDRPGALGAVASRFGALNGDVIGLEIVERSGGLAIDELVVSLPAHLPIERIVAAISTEEGVEVEDICPVGGLQYDPQLGGLEAAAIIIGADSRDGIADALCEHGCRAVRSSWACVLEQDGAVLSSWGERPNDLWLNAFVSGSPAVDTGAPGLEMDTVWVPMPAASARLIVGGDGPLRARERQRLAALARVADTWFRRMKERSIRESWALHPSQEMHASELSSELASLVSSSR